MDQDRNASRLLSFPKKQLSFPDIAYLGNLTDFPVKFRILLAKYVCQKFIYLHDLHRLCNIINTIRDFLVFFIIPC